MSIDRPGSTGDSGPDQPARPERRPVNWDLSTPVPDWVRDRPGERSDRLFPGVPAGRPPSPREYAEAAEARDAAWAEVISATPAAERTRDKPPATQHPDRATGRQPDNAADKSPDTKRIERLESDNSKLIDTVSKQADKIDKLESERDKARAEAADARTEIARLNAELEKNDKRAEGSTMRGRQLSGEEQGKRLGETKPERSRLPSAEAVAVGSAGAGIAETVATHGHLLTTWEGTAATATVGFGVAAYAWGKKKYEQHEERKAARDADRPED